MKNKTEIIIIIFLVILGLITRTLVEFGPNIEFVTAVGLAGGFFLKTNLRFFLPLFVMIISDFFLGNTLILIFTWSAYLFVPLFSLLINKSSKAQIYLSSIGAGVLFIVAFFLWSNLGVVIVSNIYSKDVIGLLLSYKMGLPYLVNQIISATITIPTVFTLVFLLEKKLLQNIKLSLHD